MVKTLTNETILIAANILFGNKLQKTIGLTGKKYLNSVMAVRQALKLNSATILEKQKLIVEMVNEINKEMIEKYLADGKAVEKEEDKYEVKPEYKDAFLSEQNSQLAELFSQKIGLELSTYPEASFNLYLEKNDGNLTDGEIDLLEMFVEGNESTSLTVPESV